MQLFRVPENCWRIARADKAACLIDGETYFPAVRQAILRAERSIFILGWDIHSRFALVRGDVKDDMPHELRDLLDAVVRLNPNLDVYIVAWDYAALLALDREWLPRYHFNWRTHKRISFQMQEAVTGASHHQKVVVIDDALAFSGGLDLTFGRWDSSDHDLADPRRRDTESGPMPRPYHDVQMMVSGPSAAALGMLARQRWYETTGECLPEAEEGKHLWLEEVVPQFEDIDIAISLTQPGEESRAEVRQIEQLYLDMLQSAERHIYIENQYLTANRIGDALVRSLECEQGPEIVVITPYNTDGWLSQYTMDVLRCRMIRRLRRADKHRRLRVYYPHLPGANEESALNVHAKVMVVDDYILRIGSSNLNNRSMGLDSECDLTLKAESEASKAAVRAVRERLLAEHLGVTPQQVAQHCEQQPSLIAAIEALQSSGRSLCELEPIVREEVEMSLPDTALLDPEAPVDSGRLRDLLVPDAERHSTASRTLLGVAALVMILGLAAIWRWTPLAELVDVKTLSDTIRAMQGSLITPLAAITLIAIGGLVAVPVTLLIVATMLVLGSLKGAICGLIGAVLSSVLAYLAGQSLGRDMLRRLAGPRLNHFSRQLARQGILTVVIVRLIPIAPFVVVNMVAGVSHIRLRDFAIGSFIGLLPGVVALGLVTEGVLRTVEQPSIYHFSLVGLVLLLLAGVGLMLRRWLLKKIR